MAEGDSNSGGYFKQRYLDCQNRFGGTRISIAVWYQYCSVESSLMFITI